MNLVEKLRVFGRRIFAPEYLEPEEIREVGQSASLSEFKAQRLEEARREAAQTLAESCALGRENANTEWRAVNGLGTLHARISLAAHHQMQALYGDEWFRDVDLMEAFLRDNPQFRIKTTRGTRGQEYGGH